MSNEEFPVEPRAYVREASGVVEIRANGDEGIWLKPERLDGDGEFHLTIDNLGEALKILHFNAGDVFPNGSGASREQRGIGNAG